MRTTHRCPKCNSDQLLYLSQIPDADGARPKTLGLARTVSGHIVGVLSAYVCRGCGYTELYTSDPGSIPVDGEVVRELSGPATSGPFR